MKTICKLLKSTGLAVTLILVISILCLIGILLPQIPAAFSATPEGYAWWVENVAVEQVGYSIYTIEALGLFDVFRSGWFIGATALLILNILACSLTRFQSIKNELQKSGAMHDAAFYRTGKHVYDQQIPSGQQLLGETIECVLNDRHYSVVTEKTSRSVYYSGEKRRLSAWATVLIHFSLILLLVGVMVGSLFGFKNDSFIVVEGGTNAIGNGTDLTLYLESFSDEYWEDGTPKDYKSDISIYKDDKKVRSATVRVNHPLSYEGVSIHQGFFGQAAGLSISDAQGNVIFRDGIALTGSRTNEGLQRPEGEASLPQGQYQLVVLGSAVNGADPYIGKNQVGIEFYDRDMNFIGWLILDDNKPQKLGELTFQYSALQYSGFLISKNPGAPLLGIAAALFLIGLGMMFYFPHRRVWVKTEAVTKDVSRILLKVYAQKELGLESESLSLLAALGFLEKPEGSNLES